MDDVHMVKSSTVIASGELVSTGEKQSVRKARHDAWLERITRRDSDSEGGSSACTNNMDDVHMAKSSTVIVSGELVSTGEKQSVREARHNAWLERITRRDSDSEGGSSACTNNMDDVRLIESSTVIVSVPRITTASSLDLNENLTPGAFAFSNEQGNLVRQIRGPITASMVEEGQTSPLSLLESEGPRSPAVLSEPRGPSAINEQSLILGELVEDSEREEELERQLQELTKNVQNQAVTGTAIVDNSGGGDHAQNAASSPFGRNSIIFLIGATLALLLVVGVILGVTIPLTTNNDRDSPSINSAVTPTQSPAPTKAPTASPTACTSLDCLTEILLQNGVADAEALQDKSSPQFLALRWLANNDAEVLDLDSTSTMSIVERYVVAVLYFATSGEGGLNVLSFLTATSVCEWKGISCNRDDLVVGLLLGTSKHEEGIVLILKFIIDSPVYFPFRFSGVGE
jgi:hypothetical protein